MSQKGNKKARPARRAFFNWSKTRSLTTRGLYAAC